MVVLIPQVLHCQSFRLLMESLHLLFLLSFLCGGCHPQLLKETERQLRVGKWEDEDCHVSDQEQTSGSDSPPLLMLHDFMIISTHCASIRMFVLPKKDRFLQPFFNVSCQYIHGSIPPT